MATLEELIAAADEAEPFECRHCKATSEDGRVIPCVSYPDCKGGIDSPPKLVFAPGCFDALAAAGIPADELEEIIKEVQTMAAAGVFHREGKLATPEEVAEIEREVAAAQAKTKGNLQ